MLSSLSNYNFRVFFAAQSFSVIGTFGQEIAQAWLILSLTHSATALGFVVCLQYLPMFLLAPWSGSIADRLGRRRLLLITQSAYACIIFIFWALTAFGLIQAWMIFILALGMGIAQALNTPTRLGFLHDLVGEKHLHNAISLNSTLYSAGRVLGPALAGLVIMVFGVAPFFFFNGLTYLGVILALLLLRTNELNHPEPVEQTPRQFRAGLKHVLHNPTLLAVMTMTTIIGIFTYEFVVSLPALAKLTYHGDAVILAIITSAYGVGAVVGGLVSAKFKPSSPAALPKMAAILGLICLGTSLVSNLIFSVIMIIAIGFAMVRYSSYANTVIQLTSAPAMRGRILAVWTAAYLGTTVIGGPIMGWVSQHIGPRTAIGIGGVAAIIAAGVGMVLMQKNSQQAPPLSTGSKN